MSLTEAPPADSPTTPAPWLRLDIRMLAVYPIRQLAGLLPFLLVLLITGQGGGWQLWVGIGAPAFVIVSGLLRWYTTRYRVTPQRVELHGGLLNRQQRAVPRDRVRTVDLHAGPVHRLFGLSVVRVGTGTGDQFANAVGLRLDAVPTAEAERLRLVLLDRAPTATGTDRTEAPPSSRGEEIASLRWSWLRFAPLSASGLVALAALTGTAFNLANELGLAPTDIGAVRRAGDGLSGISPIVAAVLIVSAVLLVAVTGSVLIYVESWWGYRLTREPDGTLLVRRGLLTTRALSVEERRLRGVEVTEPLLLRAGRGARCSAVTTGLGANSGSGALLAPAPRLQAHRVAAAALRTEATQATMATLQRHPFAALTRRLARALLPASVLCAAAAALSRVAPAVWPAVLVVLPLAVWLGVDRYRSLGNSLTGEYLVMRHGSLLRRTVALRQNGVIGWKVRQSALQRRTGLVTLHVITAAGAGHYPVIDVSIQRALELAEQTTPGLLPVVGGSRPHSGRQSPD